MITASVMIREPRTEEDSAQVHFVDLDPGDACEPSFLRLRLVRVPADEPEPKE